MKKLAVFAAVIVFCLSVIACSQENEEKNSGLSDGSPAVTAGSENIDYELLEILENRVNTTQPGTAGTTLKAVYAAKDILDWLKENKPQRNTVKETVCFFIENCEYREEAMQAFDSITHIFNMLNEGKVQDLLDNAGVDAADFKVSPQIKQQIDSLTNAISEYLLTEK